MIHQYTSSLNNPFCHLTVVNGLRHYEVDIKWCDEVISKIEEWRDEQ
ncbi:MAG: hypothetical protein QME07_06775 [bacterium]|nr:hypothetical protein [bacterium]